MALLRSPTTRIRAGREWVLVSTCLLFLLSTCPLATALHHMRIPPYPLVHARANSVPLVITNHCKETIYPGVATQAGTSPGTNGFGLSPGATRNLTVGYDWQGRVWGRTNCSFNSDGTGPSNTGGNNGGGAACSTGDCFGVVECKVAVWIISHNTSEYAHVRRVRHQQLLRSLLSRLPVARPFTTYPL